jgi:D-threo-aldose 1-dehydrogenase
MRVNELRTVGKSGLAVTPLGFGGGTIGGAAVSNDESARTVAAAWETGVRFFDTAPWYGIGRSERRLGAALAELAPKQDYRVNTKVGKTLVAEYDRDEVNKTLSPGGAVRTPRDPQSGFRVSFCYTYDAIMRQHEDSLQRLGLARVDSLTIHDIDYGYHSAEQIESHLEELAHESGGGARALEELRACGAITAIGCGCNLESRNEFSWPTGQHEALMERLLDAVDLDFLVVAGGYTLLETRALDRILSICIERSVGVIIAAPYASGWLVDPGADSTYMYAPAPPEIVDRSRRMDEICQSHGVPLASVALQFPLAHPAVAAVIPGAKHPDEARANAQHFATQIPGQVWEDLKRDGLLPAAAPTP